MPKIEEMPKTEQSRRRYPEKELSPEERIKKETERIIEERETDARAVYLGFLDDVNWVEEARKSNGFFSTDSLELRATELQAEPYVIKAPRHKNLRIPENIEKGRLGKERLDYPRPKIENRSQAVLRLQFTAENPFLEVWRNRELSNLIEQGLSQPRDYLALLKANLEQVNRRMERIKNEFEEKTEKSEISATTRIYRSPYDNRLYPTTEKNWMIYEVDHMYPEVAEASRWLIKKQLEGFKKAAVEFDDKETVNACDKALQEWFPPKKEKKD